MTQFLPEDGTTRPDAIPPAVDPWSKDWDGGSLPTEEALPPSALSATQRDLLSPPPNRFALAQPMNQSMPTSPRRRRRGAVTAIVAVLVIAGAVTAAVLVGQHGPKGTAAASGFGSPGPTGATTPKITLTPTPTATVSPSAVAPGACADGAWTLTTETLKVDSGIFGTGSGTVTLTTSAVDETRIFNPDGTGQLDVANTYTGVTSDGVDVSVVLTGKGTFTYRYDGKKVTYKTVTMPGTYEIDVAGVRLSDKHYNPLEIPGTDPMSCSGNTLIQHGDDYSRTYTRKAL